MRKWWRYDHGRIPLPYPTLGYSRKLGWNGRSRSPIDEPTPRMVNTRIKLSSGSYTQFIASDLIISDSETLHDTFFQRNPQILTQDELILTLQLNQLLEWPTPHLPVNSNSMSRLFPHWERSSPTLKQSGIF